MTSIPPTITLTKPKKVDILAYRGDSGRFRITLTDNLGAPVDLTPMSWSAEIKETTNDSIVIALFDIIPVVGESNSVDVVLPADQAELLLKKCVYDVEMKDGAEVTTLIYGSIKVTEDVSQP